MSDEVKPGATPTEPEPGATPGVTTEPKLSETPPVDKVDLEALQRSLKNKEEETVRLHKKIEAFERADQERKDAQLSETDRLKKNLAEREAELNALKINELKRRAAAKHNIPEALALRLQGNTPEEIEADAEELAKTLPKIPERPKISATNPGQVPSQSREQQVKELLWGQHQGRSIFDPDYVAAHGGGVFEVTKNEE